MNNLLFLITLGGYAYSFLKLTSFYTENQLDLLSVFSNWINDYKANSYTRVIVDVSKNG
jgi:hypothetical protein